MTPDEVRQLLSRPTITPKQLHKTGVLPLTLNGIYQAIQRKEIDVAEFGRKKAIITAPLRRKLGIDAL
jgi:hypothetical protein